jgi:hypothetical protein
MQGNPLLGLSSPALRSVAGAASPSSTDSPAGGRSGSFSAGPLTSTLPTPLFLPSSSAAAGEGVAVGCGGGGGSSSSSSRSLRMTQNPLRSGGSAFASARGFRSAAKGEVGETEEDPPPAPSVSSTAAASVAGGFSASVSGAASPAAAATPAPTAWVAKWSQKKSAVYYVNTLTGRSQWTAPAELQGEGGGEEARQSAPLRSLRSPSGAATPASPRGGGLGSGVLGSASGAGAGGGVRGTEWEERASKKYPGRSFYINAASGERAWELPEGHTLV